MAARLASTLTWWRFESEWARSHDHTASSYDGLDTQAVAFFEAVDGDFDSPSFGIIVARMDQNCSHGRSLTIPS